MGREDPGAKDAPCISEFNREEVNSTYYARLQRKSLALRNTGVLHPNMHIDNKFPPRILCLLFGRAESRLQPPTGGDLVILFPVARGTLLWRSRAMDNYDWSRRADPTCCLD